MAEEKKAPEAASTPAAAPAAPQGQAAPAADPRVKAKKNKKIGQMTLKEIEEKLNSVRERMGRLDSRYGKELLKRKDALTKK